jgi:hypothetical protein
VRSLAAAGHHSKARQAALLARADDRDCAFLDVAMSLCRTRRFDDAMAIGEELQPAWRPILKSLVAKSRAEAGEDGLRLAREAANEVSEISDTRLRAMAIELLSQAFIAQVNTEEAADQARQAMTLAKTLSQSDAQCRVIQSAGAVLIRAGRSEEARKSLESLKPGRARDQVAEALASSLVEEGEVEQMLRLLDDLERDSERSGVLSTILPGLLEADDHKTIIAALGKLEQGYHRPKMLEKLTDLSIERGQLARAVEAIETVGTSQRYPHLKKLLSHLVDAGEQDLASAAIEKAQSHGLLGEYAKLLARKYVEAGRIDHTWDPENMVISPDTKSR